MATRRVEVVLSAKESRQRAILDALEAITHSGGKTELLRRLAVRGLRALQRRYEAIPTDATGSLDHIASALDLDEDYRIFSMFIALQAALGPPAQKRLPMPASPPQTPAPVPATTPLTVSAEEPATPAYVVEAVASPTPRANAPAGPRDWSKFRKLAGEIGVDAKA